MFGIIRVVANTTQKHNPKQTKLNNLGVWTRRGLSFQLKIQLKFLII